MRRYGAIAAIEHRADAVRVFGATSLYLFGSTARHVTTADTSGYP